jgi:hypothetical protein
MALEVVGRGLAAAAVGLAAFAPVAGLPSMTYAQSDCTCIVPAPAAGAAAGMLSQANGNVFVSGPDGLQAVVDSAELGPTTGVETGARGSAMISYGPTCNLALGGATEVIVRPLEDGNLCVQVFEREPPSGGIDGLGLALAAGGGLAVAGALVFGLGLHAPVSQ